MYIYIYYIIYIYMQYCYIDKDHKMMKSEEQYRNLKIFFKAIRTEVSWEPHRVKLVHSANVSLDLGEESEEK